MHEGKENGIRGEVMKEKRETERPRGRKGETERDKERKKVMQSKREREIARRGEERERRGTFN